MHWTGVPPAMVTAALMVRRANLVGGERLAVTLTIHAAALVVTLGRSAAHLRRS